MTCPYCSREIPEEADVCPYCGATVEEPEEVEYAEEVSRSEFFKTLCSEKVRKELKASVIILYVCAGLTFFVQLVSGMFPIDGLILAGLTFWMQKTKSKASAIVLLVYSAFSTIMSVVLTGRLGGWLIVLLAVLALVFIGKGEKEWRDYESQFLD